MSRIVYVNGAYVPEAEARISVFDRGFLFGDAVYEVAAVVRGRLIDNAGHLVRLQRSLREIDIDTPWSADDIVAIQQSLVDKNNLDEGVVYLQISRGIADRAFVCPPGVEPSLVMFTQEKSILANPTAERGLSVITVPEIRWRRRDIKTTNLLAAVMAVHAAQRAGADDAWLIEDGLVTEGSASNAFIVTSESTVVTRSLSNDILAGITREAVLRLCAGNDVTLDERPFSPDEAGAAKEAFITSASNFVVPVVRLDGESVGDGAPGPITRRLRELYIELALAETSR